MCLLWIIQVKCNSCLDNGLQGKPPYVDLFSDQYNVQYPLQASEKITFKVSRSQRSISSIF